MNSELRLPSEKEASELSDRFDRKVCSTLQELVERQAHERFETLMEASGEGLSSPVRVGAEVYIAHAVEDDPKVAKYDNPSDLELLEVLNRAAKYTGDWYHSRVVLKFYGSWSPLQRAVAELEEESGVFVIFDYEASSETVERYEKLLNCEGS